MGEMGMRGRRGEELLNDLANYRPSACCIPAANLGWFDSERWRIKLYSGWDGGVEREVFLPTLRLLPPLELFLGDLDQRR